MASPVRVGLIGANGFMGKSICAGLITASTRGEVDFTVLHRAGSDTSKLPSHVKKREVDLLEGKLSDLKAALAGLQVVISALSPRKSQTDKFDGELRLVDALVGSKELITFVPSDWATPQTKEVLENSADMAFFDHKEKVRKYAREKGVPVTVIATASVPWLVFAMESSSYKVKANTIEAYVPPSGQAQKGKRGLASRKFIEDAVAYLLRDRLKDLPNKDFSLVELEYSVDDLAADLAKLNDGQEPQRIDYSEKDYQRDLSSGFWGAMKAGRMKSFHTGLEWPGETVTGATLPGWKEHATVEYMQNPYLNEE